MRKMVLICTMCLMALSVHAQKCAVLDFQLGTSVNAEETDAISYNFRTNFYPDNYNVIDTERVNKTIKDLGYDKTGLTKQQLLELGRKLEAKIIVVGTLNKLMDEYSVDVQVVDVSTGTTIASEGNTFQKADYRTSMEELAARLGEKLTSQNDSGMSVSSGDKSSQSGGSKAGYIDLGLSVKWATCNLGANKPEDYGDYYAWGETDTKLTYDWSVYKWCNGSETPLTKYNYDSDYGTVDNKTEFKDYDYEDDAARRALGGKWRVPTDAEWTELLDNCTWTWVENYNGSGINGRMVTSKTNSNSIFLPAAGDRSGSSLRDAGSDGYYWSSSLNTDHPFNAWGVSFYSDDVYRYDYSRFDGLSVRPVSE